MKVVNFSYNGFYGKITPGFAPYTAEFIEWTNDPGITKCQCSDGQIRNLPTFALIGFDPKNYPKQQKTGVLFGAPCNS